jgi:hypothetical protein
MTSWHIACLRFDIILTYLVSVLFLIEYGVELLWPACLRHRSYKRSEFGLNLIESDLLETWPTGFPLCVICGLPLCDPQPVCGLPLYPYIEFCIPLCEQPLCTLPLYYTIFHGLCEVPLWDLSLCGLPLCDQPLRGLPLQYRYIT